MTTARYRELDALRGIAALLVVLLHFSFRREQLRYGFYLGATGVDLFFLISGFVIFMSIIKVSSVTEFIVNRFTRLYPTFWVCVTITFLVKIHVDYYANQTFHTYFTEYLFNLTMFQGYFGVPNMDEVYWTLVIEMLFYIFIGLLFKLKKLDYIINIGLVILALLLCNYIFPESGFSTVFEKVKKSIPLISFMPLFLSGIVFYKIITEKENLFRYYSILIFCFIIKIIPVDNGPLVSHTEYIIMLFIYFLLFVLFVNHKLKFIITKPTLFLGKISYALYLVHQFISSEVLLQFFINNHHINYWFASLVTLFIVISIATAITYFIEIPVGKKLNRYLKTLLKLNTRK